ncbi:MAG: diguanylate cyclase [Cyanobacteria bacterium P01_E01_bin.45]
MRFSFSLKLGIAISCLTVGLTSASVVYVYRNTRHLLLTQINHRLKDMAQMGAFLIDEEMRDDIVTLSADIDRDSRISPSDIATLESGSFLGSLPDADIERYHQAPQFQRLSQALRAINRASRDRVDPLQEFYPQEFLAYPNAVLPYIAVRTPESPELDVIKFVASFAPDPEGEDWPGNPIGNLYRPTSPIFARAFTGESQVSESFYSDAFYTSTTAVVPIKDSSGETIAVLGLDMLVTSEFNHLARLRAICSGIIAISFLLSILLAAVIARWLSQPLKTLTDAAEQVRNRDFSRTIHFKTGDEIEVLADTFNLMVRDLQRYSSTLETQNQQLANYSQTLESKVKERTSELRTANARLQLLATSDGLTNLSNRYHFDSDLDRAWRRAQLAQLPLTLILLDIDYFKRYNDTYGHQAGDDCLRLVAQTIERAVPKGAGVVARYGGEEFAILLVPGRSAGNHNVDGLKIAEAIRQSLAHANIRHDGSPLDSILTVSQGIGTLIPTSENATSVLIEMADRALYRAKAKGRNCIEIATTVTNPRSA